MTILIRNATIISMNEKQERIQYNTDILIKEDKIEKIEQNINEKSDKIIDATR